LKSDDKLSIQEQCELFTDCLDESLLQLQRALTLASKIKCAQGWLSEYEHQLCLYARQRIIQIQQIMGTKTPKEDKQDDGTSTDPPNE